MRKFNKKYWRCRFKSFKLSDEEMDNIFEVAAKISQTTIFCRYHIMVDIEAIFKTEKDINAKNLLSAVNDLIGEEGI